MSDRDKPSRFPDTLVLIFGLVVLAQILTYVLPAGRYDREPDPGGGTAWVDPDAGEPLRARLAAARAARSVEVATLAERFGVAPRTVEVWELGPDEVDADGRSGVPIEATVGALLDRWARENVWPTADELATWKSAVTGGGVRERLVPKSYSETEADALPWYSAVSLLPKGLGAASDIIFFVFLIGGVLGIMRATGAFDAMIGSAIHAFGDKAWLLVVGTITLFAVGSGVIGMAEEYVPFITLLVTMSLALKLDAMVGIAIVLVGYAVGYGCAPINPFTVLVAQGVAEIEPTSGWWYRVTVMLVCLVVGLHHVLRYASRVRRDASSSLVADVDYSHGFELPDDVALTPRRALVLGAFVVTVVTFVYGVKVHGWWFGELSAVFVGLGIVSAIIGGLTPNGAAKKFCEGAAELTTTALLIGFARTIEVVLVDGGIIDTVVYSIASVLEGFDSSIGAVGMLVVQTLCNFFIPSGSGQAYVTMPIMAPLADELGVQRQVAVLAYQFGDGFTNVITPTNAAFMGMLAMARVPYQRWLRFALPLMIKLYLIAALALAAGVWIGYS